MKNIMLLVGCFCFSLFVRGQSINDHWILKNIDLDFSTNPPIANSISSTYSYGTVSDDNGELLFYIGDDFQVYNKNHQIMQGGDTNLLPLDLYYDKLRNPIVIFPFPSDSKRYVIYVPEEMPTISTGSAARSGISAIYSLNYIVVNFNSNPLGEVECVCSGYGEFSYNMTGLGLIKNLESGENYLLSIGTSGYELRNAIPSSSGSSSYTLDYKIDYDNFFPTGFIPDDIYPPYPYNYGESRKSSVKIKVSPDFSKVAGIIRTEYTYLGYPNYTPTNTYKCFTVNFNESNLSFTNFISFGNETFNVTSSSIQKADIEFSPDSQKLYYIKNGAVYVKNLANLANPERKLYQTNSTDYPTGFEHLQKDVYGNIWVASSLSTNNRNKYLHKIENPNSYSSSSISVNAIYLQNDVIPDNVALPYYIPKLSLPCHTTLAITTNLNSGQSEYKQASNSITASNTINNGATAIYHAQNRVVLTPGFNAKAGSTFKAYIEGCSDEFSNRTTRRMITEDDMNHQSVVDVSLSPNPNNGIFELNFTTSLNEQIEVEIYDINSRIVDQFALQLRDSSTLLIQNSDLKNGLYFLKIKSKTVNKTIKFIKK